MKQILIVDDEPHMLRVLKLYLERAGYSVETCGNGAEALKLIAANVPDAVVTDIQMPVMTGQEFCLALEASMPQREFPVFVMTSMTNSEHRTWTQKINKLEFLEKPLSMRGMLRALEGYLGHTVAQPGNQIA